MAARSLLLTLFLGWLGAAITAAWAAEPQQETPAEQAPAAETPAAETPAADTPAAEAPAAEEEETDVDETAAEPAMEGEETESETEETFVRPKEFSLIPKRPEGSIPAKVTRYARRLVEEFDANADGQLEQAEWERFLVRRYDQNADGLLTENELKDLFALRLSQLFDQFDSDGDGLLTADEWDRLFIWRYDYDGDGRLQPEELKELLLARLKQIFQKYDVAGAAGEGLIDWNELGAIFVAWYDTNGDGLLHPQESMLLPLWALDANHDRQLQPLEIKQIIRYRARQVLVGYDKDKDGKLQEAEVNEETIGRYDKNEDQVIDEAELAQWATDEFDRDGKAGLDWKELGAAFVTVFDGDRNKQLDAYEVGQALVARHDQNADQWLEEYELGPILWRYDNNNDGQLNRNETAWIFLDLFDEDGDQKLARHEFTQSLLGRYDLDGDGQFQEPELARMRGDLWSALAADVDSNGMLTTKELTDRVALHGRGIKMWLMVSAEDAEAYFDRIFSPVSAPAEGSEEEDRDSPTKANPSETAAAPQAGPAAADPRERMKYFIPAARLKGLPDWFLKRDADGDGQVSLSEFTPKPSHAALAEFYKHDTNRDGVITVKEAGGAIVSLRKPEPKSKPKPERKPGEKAPAEEKSQAEEKSPPDGQPLSKAEDRARLKERGRSRRKAASQPSGVTLSAPRLSCGTRLFRQLFQHGHRLVHHPFPRPRFGVAVKSGPDLVAAQLVGLAIGKVADPVV